MDDSLKNLIVELQSLGVSVVATIAIPYQEAPPDDGGTDGGSTEPPGQTDPPVPTEPPGTEPPDTEPKPAVSGTGCFGWFRKPK